MKKPKLRDVEAGTVSLDMQDATVPWKYIVTKQHIWGSRSKTDKPLTQCVQENAINSMPGVYACKVNKTMAQVIRKGNPHIAVRYTLSQDGQKIAEINDKYGKKALLKELKSPMELWLEVPRPGRALSKTRSPEFKALRKASRLRRKGKVKRAYTTPTKKGVRSGSGQGLAHMWPSHHTA